MSLMMFLFSCVGINILVLELVHAATASGICTTVQWFSRERHLRVCLADLLNHFANQSLQVRYGEELILRLMSRWSRVRYPQN